MTSHPPRRRATTVAAVALAAASMVLAGCTSSGSTTDTSSGSTAAGTPKPGGTLTVGIVGGSTKDSLDANNPITHPDEARVINLYSPLATFDTNNNIVMDLADKITGSADAKTWTVHLRPGLKFSNGAPITAADVIFTYQRITDPKNPLGGAAALATLERNKMTAPDPQTVVFPFSAPTVTFPETAAGYVNGIVPVGYDPTKPISSGPFMLQAFTPGQQSTFVKNPNYWRTGQPYLDKLVLIDFPDDTARVNALLGGQVDAIDQLPLGQYSVISANPQLKVLESKTGNWDPFTMRVDQPPFNNPLVRQAFRLIVDRQQMVEQVLGGHGTIGNDMYSPLDPCYPSTIPQRAQDIAKAKQLLAEAGQSNLTVTLYTSPVAAGIVEAAQVFAQQAKAAGVTVNVQQVDPGTYYGSQYLKWTFAQDFYFTRNYISQAFASTMPGAPYNETHWSNPQWTALVNQANSTLDPTARCKIIAQAQQIEYDQGGYIIWGFPNNVDAYSSKVSGFVPDKTGIPLSSYGFDNVWLNQ
ncbi:MAG: ABC transporter substrate-binding protein [Candidatus Nanopelagicales bacterium]